MAVTVEDEEEDPPPTYLDAIVKIKRKNKGHHMSWGQRLSIYAIPLPEVGEPKSSDQAQSTPSVKTIQAKNGKEVESSQTRNGDDNS